MDSAASLPRIRKHGGGGGGGDGDRDRHGGAREHHSRDDRRDDRRGDRRDDRRDREGHHDRRRSRSPHHRSGGGSGRHEQDSYASSRDHRAQEREERYSRRDPRRGDRDWDRDRGGRDRRRRDDDRFGGGRDERRGGARRGDDRAERDEFAQQRGARPRSKSPNKKREPTPDLTDVVSVLDRKRRLTQWDIKPPGYENVTAEQAKLSGMFPLPGAPRQQAVDPSKLQSLINQPGGAGQAALKPSNSRQSKRLFVGNLPSSATDESIVEFFNLQLNGLNVIETTNPCISSQITPNRDLSLIEFKNTGEATMALTLDGTHMDGNMNGAAAATPGLSIRRPKDYIVAGAAEEDAPMEGEVSTTVPDTPNKLSVSNIIPNLDDDQIKELVSTFGALRAFTLVKDNSTGESRGVAFLEYVDPKVTSMAVEGLNGMEVGGKALRVQHASVGVSQSSGLEMSVNAMSMLAGTTSNDLEEGRVLQLLNMVTAEELIDQGEYDEIVEDVKEECEKYGPIVEIKVPRPTMGSRQSAGVGKIFIKYDTPASAKRALQDLAGRKFADRTVISTYFSEESFDVNAW